MKRCEKCGNYLFLNDECYCKKYKYRHPEWTGYEWEEKYARDTELLAEDLLRNYNGDDPDTSGDFILEDPIEIMNDEGIIEKWNGFCELELSYYMKEID